MSRALTALDFSDAQQCLSVLASLPLTNLPYVEATLSGLLDGMLATPPAPAAYLEVLEKARAPLAFMQEELAQRYAHKPLPPGDREEETLLRVVGLSQAMVRAYMQVAELGRGEPGVRRQAALICQRCIHYSGRALLEYFRARREVPSALWGSLNGHYVNAEQQQIATVPVSETLDEHKQSCAEAYAAVLLIEIANPYAHAPRELSWLFNWGARFSRFTEIAAVNATTDLQAYVVDLSLDQGAKPLELVARGPNLRRLVTTRLAAEMQNVLSQLRFNIAPAELGLGADCMQPYCAVLLGALYRPWCLNASPRRFPRRGGSGTAFACYGFDAIHYYVSGREFVQPEHVRSYTRSDWEVITTWRYQVDPSEQLHVRAAQIGYTLEPWEVGDQSVAGFRMYRRGSGHPLSHGQLIGLRPPDGDLLLLCQVSWLMYEADGDLQAGVHVLPGVPQAIGVRPTGINVPAAEKYSRGFLLPAMPALKEVASVVLPRGWFIAQRVIELFAERRFEVRLTELLTQGPDFDRVAFAPINSRSQA